MPRNGIVRLYLSSYRLGNHADRLLELLRGGPSASVIMNGMDGSPPSTRRKLFERTRGDLAALGLKVRELDLRKHFKASDGLARELEGSDLIWANGGNAFTLNMAMRQSGFAQTLKEWLASDDIVYAGYSAGAVVAGNTLRGIELVDSAEPEQAVPPGYRSEILWDGLGLVDYGIVPHYRSDHWESERIEEVVRYCTAEGIPFRAIRDGEVILVDGDSEEFLAPDGRM